MEHACLFVLDRHGMSRHIHALVQHTNDHHTSDLRYVECDVRSIFVTSQLRREVIGLPAKHWLLREDLEAFMQAVQVAPGLHRSEVHDRIFMDAIEIGCCFP